AGAAQARGTAPAACPWVAAWGASQMIADGDNALPEAARHDVTLRQVLRPSIGGTALRVRFSNVFGTAPLRIDAVSLALATKPGGSAITPGSNVALHFGGQPGVVIPAGGEWLSDPVAMPLAPFADLAVSLHLPAAPARETGHPGSRTTSYWTSGNHVGDETLAGGGSIDRWYLVSGVEVRACATPVVVALGDSITDGRGSTTNGNDRWTDRLARRLGGKVAVINQGIGGNRVLLDGLGPNAMARFDRDVLAVPGVRSLIVLEGINDIGTLTREHPVSAADHAALVAQVTGAYAQIVSRAHAHGIKVYGGTVMPFMGMDYYHPDALNEADRQAINAWIRTPGHFDAVIDFDKALRDPAHPDRLDPRYDSGDSIHPGPAGYAAMAQAVPLELLR
ncbi:SGNH/GDSL hydrolase family protein, partial [Novosphingobium sp. 1949]